MTSAAWLRPYYVKAGLRIGNTREDALVGGGSCPRIQRVRLTNVSPTTTYVTPVLLLSFTLVILKTIRRVEAAKDTHCERIMLH